MDFSNVFNSTITIVLLIVLAVSFVTLCLYYGLLFFRMYFFHGKNQPRPDEVAAGELPSVSVVIVAHNEAEFLKESLPYLLEQDYPDFEVVVVDYTSHDDTPFVLRVCAENYPNLKPISFPEDVNMFHGKKYPLSIGIKSAKNDVILLTEPDSIPKDFNWIRAMVGGYFDASGKMADTKIVLGYSILSQNKSLLNAFEQYDNMAYSGEYLGLAAMGMPVTGTGRNLSYRRDYFFERGAFISHYSIEDGADDLFVNQNAKGGNTAVVMEEGAAVMTEPRPTFGAWHLERLHKYSTHRFHKSSDRLIHLSYPLSLVLFYAMLLTLWIKGLFPWQILLAILVVKTAWQVVSYSMFAKRLKVKVVQCFSPFFEIYFLFANTILYLLTLRKKK